MRARPTASEINQWIMEDLVDEGDGEVLHYGTKHHSGRYPWGSGEDPYQGSRTYLSFRKELRDQGFTPNEIALLMGHAQPYRKTAEGKKVYPGQPGYEQAKEQADTDWDRALLTIAREQKVNGDIIQAQRFRAKGMSVEAIADRLDLTQGVVRKHLAASEDRKQMEIKNLADGFKQQIANGDYVDIGLGTEHFVGVSTEKMRAALAYLELEGYGTINYQVTQQGTGFKTTRKTLVPPGTTYKELVTNQDKVKPPSFVTQEQGDLDNPVVPIRPPVGMDRSRVMVVYADQKGPLGEQSGSDRDGFMLARPGVDDLDIGASSYAQVRIKVGDSLYAKGMVARGPEEAFPDGVDLIVYTNKHSSDPDSAFKPLKDDVNNPFGATIVRQNYSGERVDATTPGTQGVVNIVNEEGKWATWSKSLSSQMLSKQELPLIRQQTDLALKERAQDYAEIMSISNPIIRKQMLEAFADDCAGTAVHLKAAAMPRQSSPVLIPIVNIKPNECYAPGYNNGDRLALIRHPHGGRFEIAEVIVNNSNAEARAIVRNAKDGIGIHYTVAQRLSGADFDGDNVICIPNNQGQIKSAPALPALKAFDTMDYASPYCKPQDGKTNQRQMGSVSNLITDMTIQGADTDEIARAVRHSMVVIDAKKKPLDVDQSYMDNNIAQLKIDYQGGVRRGASTLISRASGKVQVDQRSMRFTITEEGEKLYKETGDTYIASRYRVPTVGKDGQPTGRMHWESYKQVTAGIKDPVAKRALIDDLRARGLEDAVVKPRMQSSTAMAEARTMQDIQKLSRGTAVEEIYADYAWSLKTMERQARLAAQQTGMPQTNSKAKMEYAPQVASLKAQIIKAEKNSPKERQAHALAGKLVKEKMETSGYEFTADEKKKLQGQTLVYARSVVGAKKPRVVFSDKEWEAVEAGAISGSMMKSLMRHADSKKLRQRAMPKVEADTVTYAKEARIKALLAAGHTYAEIADAMDLSVSTIQKYK